MSLIDPTGDLTGRDDYIIMKAFAYAIVAIRLRPERWQELSDLEDMETIFAAIVPYEEQRAHKISEAFSHLHPRQDFVFDDAFGSLESEVEAPSPEATPHV